MFSRSLSSVPAFCSTYLLFLIALAQLQVFAQGPNGGVSVPDSVRDWDRRGRGGTGLTFRSDRMSGGQSVKGKEKLESVPESSHRAGAGSPSSVAPSVTGTMVLTGHYADERGSPQAGPSNSKAPPGSFGRKVGRAFFKTKCAYQAVCRAPIQAKDAVVGKYRAVRDSIKANVNAFKQETSKTSDKEMLFRGKQLQKQMSSKLKKANSMPTSGTGQPYSKLIKSASSSRG